MPFADRQKRYLILTKEFWRDAAITASTTTIAVASPYDAGSRYPRRSHRSGMPYSRATPTSRDFYGKSPAELKSRNDERRAADPPLRRRGPPTRHDWLAIHAEIARRCINPRPCASTCRTGKAF